MKRIFITGLGVVSALGNTPDDYWQQLLNGSSSVQEYPMPTSFMNNRLYYPVAAEQTKNTSTASSRCSSFALDAATQALEDAGLNHSQLAEVAISVGTGMGGYDQFDHYLYSSPDGKNDRQLLDRGIPADHPDSHAFFDVAGELAYHLGTGGRAATVSTACAAGAYSLARAVDMIQSGQAQAVLAGGAEAFSIVPQGCFNRLGALDSVVCRPFAAHREGTLFGEGAAFLLLESQDLLTSRRAQGMNPVIYGELLGYGISCDAYHLTAPESKGEQIERAARHALMRSEVSPDQIAIVVAHGTGTLLNDQIESRVMHDLLGSDPWVLPIKARIGHGGGSAGAFSCLTAVLALAHQTIPPCGIQEQIDASCEVRLNHGKACAHESQYALVNAYAFGGNNISLVLSAYPRRIV